MQSKSGKSAGKISMAGAILFQFAAGITTIWGSINVYYFSHFLDRGYDIHQNTNSIVLFSLIAPIIILLPVSMVLVNKIGYAQFIRIAALIYALSPFALYFSFTFPMYVIFGLIVPVTALTLNFVPITRCIWGHFLKHKNKATGALLISQAIGGVAWNAIFTHTINPDNENPELTIDTIPIFSDEINSRLLFTSKIVFGLTGLLAVVGAFLIQKQEEQGNNLNEGRIQPKVVYKESANGSQLNEQKQVAAAPAPPSQTQIRICNYLADGRFMILFVCCILLNVYPVYIFSNMKLIYMPIVNNDHFISYCSMLMTVASAVSVVFWGWLGDYKGFLFSFVLLVALDTVIKLFGVFATDPGTIALLSIALGFVDRGPSILIGPGFIEIFGLEIATALLPYKGLALIFGFIMTFSLQISLTQYLQTQLFLSVLMSLNLICIFLTIIFVKRYRKSMQPQEDAKTPQAIY